MEKKNYGEIMSEIKVCLDKSEMLVSRVKNNSITGEGSEKEEFLNTFNKLIAQLRNLSTYMSDKINDVEDNLEKLKDFVNLNTENINKNILKLYEESELNIIEKINECTKLANTNDNSIFLDTENIKNILKKDICNIINEVIKDELKGLKTKNKIMVDKEAVTIDCNNTVITIRK